MPVSHPRPASPPLGAAHDGEPSKKFKATHPSSINDETVPQAFLPEVFAHTNIAKMHSSYVDSQPYHFAMVEKLFQDDLLNRVKDEIRSELNFTTKETDIYKARLHSPSPIPAASLNPDTSRLTRRVI
jgi:hypothetical protein